MIQAAEIGLALLLHSLDAVAMVFSVLIVICVIFSLRHGQKFLFAKLAGLPS